MSMCPYVFASDVSNTNGQAESTSSSVSSVDESEKKVSEQQNEIFNSEESKQNLDDNVSNIENPTEKNSEAEKAEEKDTPVFDEEHSETVEPRSVDITLSGESVNLVSDAVDFSMDDANGKTLKLPKTRGIYELPNTIGTLSGTLTSENTYDLYVLPGDTVFSALAVVSNNDNYTLTLSVVDWTQQTITLSPNHVYMANQMVTANFDIEGKDPNKDYGWVVQSGDGTYGDNYAMPYNTCPSSYGTPAYISGDLQKLYSVGDQKLKINGQVQNIDYQYDRDVEYPEREFWNKLHIYVRNANVRVAHIGGVRYKSGLNTHDFPNAILLSVLSGTDFYHSFWQNPPHYHYVDKDMLKIPTPRKLTPEDINERGGHWLIYNIDTGKVEEFVSGLIQPWSSLGDRSDFEIY